MEEDIWCWPLDSTWAHAPAHMQYTTHCHVTLDDRNERIRRHRFWSEYSKYAVKDLNENISMPREAMVNTTASEPKIHYADYRKIRHWGRGDQWAWRHSNRKYPICSTETVAAATIANQRLRTGRTVQSILIIFITEASERQRAEKYPWENLMTVNLIA